MSWESPSHRLLQVEDDAPLASMVAVFLSPHGFDVSGEGRGDTAVDRIPDQNWYSSPTCKPWAQKDVDFGAKAGRASPLRVPGGIWDGFTPTSI